VFFVGVFEINVIDRYTMRRSREGLERGEEIFFLD
jgi:hypothetical protein